MKSQTIFWIAIFSLLVQSWGQNTTTTTTTTTESPTTPEPKPPIKASTCPEKSTISPCACYKELVGLQLECARPASNQTSVENLFRELRRVNGIPEDRGVDIYSFSLEGTELTQFDLAPLYGSQIERLDIGINYRLTKLVTSGNPRDYGSIHLDQFIIMSAAINGDDFGETFKYFSVQMTDFIASNFIINSNNNNNNTELLPGLSALVNLESLQLAYCNVSGPLTNAHLKAFPRLQSLNLEENQIDGIGENVFSPDVYYINLRGNKLNETSIHPSFGIAGTGTGSPKQIRLDSNLFTTLPSEMLLPFLDAHPENTLSLQDNPLICDQRLSWLKSRREEFEYRVVYAYCSNDFPHNVFDSDLIP